MDDTTSSDALRCGSVMDRRDPGSSLNNSAVSSGKRAKRSSEAEVHHFDSVPESVLLSITSYLEPTSRVLLAVALTASPAAWREAGWEIQPSAAGKTIMAGQNLRYKDGVPGFGSKYSSRVSFADTDKTLAAKLSDDDIGSILSLVGSTSKIEVVELTHCIGMHGYGLEPLRCSLHLRQLDLSLVGRKESPNLNPEPAILEQAVLPILESIIDSQGSALKHIIFPKKWRARQSEYLVQFLTKCNRVLNQRNILCTAYKSTEDNGALVKCENVCLGTDERPWFNTSGDRFGTQNFMCCNMCMCQECAGAEYAFSDLLCSRCERKHYDECSETLTCTYCQKTTCHECTMIRECYNCEKTSCGDCVPVFECDCGEAKCISCVPHDFCDHPQCNWSNCRDCGTESDTVRMCFDCNEKYCPEHLLQMHLKRGEESYCTSCNERAAAQLSEYNYDFERWVKVLEKKYGVVGRELDSSDDFPQALRVRDQLRQRCNAVGNKLSLKQKRFEQYDRGLEHYEYPLDLDNTGGGYQRNERGRLINFSAR